MLAAALGFVAVVSAAVAVTNFPVDISGQAKSIPFPHLWEECVGSGHAALALRTDWRALLNNAHRDLGFKSVRFHGVLDDDMSAYLNGEGNWFNIDSAYDAIVALGMTPYVEISFMPQELASNNGNTTVFHYKGITTPPKDWNVWTIYIASFVQHLSDRYGPENVARWRFEVWNEPNCGFYVGPGCGPESGNKEAYYELYLHTSIAVKSVNETFLVGGPSTAQVAWIPEFLDFVHKRQLPIDFVSTHLYPTDPLVTNTRGGFEDALLKAAQQAAPLPVFISEFNAGLGLQILDQSYAASFMVHVASVAPRFAAQGIVGMSYWTFGDIFEEGGFISTPFADGNKFGLQTDTGVAKPIYRAMQALFQLPSELTTLATLGNVDLLVGGTAPGPVLALVTNFNRLGLPIDTRSVTLTFKSNEALPAFATIYYIDSNHTNPLQAFKDMGSPKYPTKEQTAKMVQASKVVTQQVPFSPQGEITVVLEAYATAVVSFQA